MNNKDQRLHTRGVVSTERRTSPRTVIRRPAYINFEPYNRAGVITDISETGLRFHTVDALDQGGIVRISILLGAAKQIEAVGEVMWKEAERRVGGLRFAVLPPGAVDQIRDWAEASTNGADPSGADISESPGPGQGALTQEALVANIASPQSETASAPDDRVSESRSVPQSAELPRPIAPPISAAGTDIRLPWVPPSMRPRSGAPTMQTHPNNPLNPGAPSPAETRMPLAAYQHSTPMPWITHFDPDPPRGRWAVVRGVLGGVIICLLLAGAGWFAAERYAGNGGAFPFRNPFASHPVASNPLGPPPDLPSADVPDVTNTPNPANPLPSQQSPSRESSSPASPKEQPNMRSDLNPRPIPNPDSHLAPPSPATVGPETKSAQPSTLPQSTVAQAPVDGAAPQDTLSAARGSLSPTPTPGAVQPARAPDAGESQLTLARQYLDGRSRPRNPAAASQLLWSAVEKGNSVAEMDLADLYLRGDGVARNCDQARVLLSAASGKGNAEAMQKLSELNRTGCR